MNSKRGYEGRISHGGAQVVKAPFRNSGKAKGGSVLQGDDLRVGRGNKPSKGK